MCGTTFEKLTNRPGDTDEIALCAGRIYWIALVLTDNENVASTLTRKVAELLSAQRSQSFNRSLDNWARRIAIKACVALQRAELYRTQRDNSAWDEATHALQFESFELVNNLSIVSVGRAVRSLPVLPRFMFVMRTLHRYSAQEAAEMIGIPESTCEAAGRYALVSLTKIIQSSDFPSWVTTHKFA